MKFVMTQAVCPEGMQLLDGIADVYVADNQDPNNYLDEMKDADALIVRIAKCDANAIENSPKLKVIGRTGVGYDSVDVKKATELGIPVVITPGANNRSVAEHAVAMIFALSKNLIEAQNEMCKGNWEIRGAKKAFELEGKTVGILGLGAIGRETAKICKGCGMSIAAYDPFMTKEQPDVRMFENNPEQSVIQATGNVMESLFEVDYEIKDGDVLTFGNTTIRFYLVPGHTKGCIACFFDVTDGKCTKHAGYYGGFGFNTLQKEFLEDIGDYEYVARREYAQSIDKVIDEPVDIFVGNHTSNVDLINKRNYMIEHPGSNPFIDSTAWKKYLGNKKKELMLLEEKEKN